MSPTDQPVEDTQPTRKPGEMPFLEHLEELRKRLVWSVLIVIVFSGVAFTFADQLVAWFIAPLDGVKLHVTEVTGSFSAYLKICLFAGLGASLPFLFYQLWAFVAPGLYPKERKLVIPFLVVATLLFVAGSGFCYLYVLPVALKFMIGFADDLLSPIITVNSYISFAGMLLIAFGLSFELPIIAFLLGKLGIVSSSFLSKGRRIAVVLILIVSAILTPTPDVVTQLLLAVPMYLLYETSIVVVRVTGRRN
ncbi:MAG: twin-arginine translocase subunit TatC [bacterium]|nr:twin-arginine translocase subunit TatC [bacterium]